MIDTKFNIGDRVTVTPNDDDDALLGPFDGVVSKVWPKDDDGDFYMIELDEPLACQIDDGMSDPPWYLDAAGWELTHIDKPYKVWVGSGRYEA